MKNLTKTLSDVKTKIKDKTESVNVVDVIKEILHLDLTQIEEKKDSKREEDLMEVDEQERME